jgi:hypothetical protein
VERSESRIAQEAASTGREKIASQSRRTQAERSQKKYSRNAFGSFWRQKERTLKKENHFKNFGSIREADSSYHDHIIATILTHGFFSVLFVPKKNQKGYRCLRHLARTKS